MLKDTMTHEEIVAHFRYELAHTLGDTWPMPPNLTYVAVHKSEDPSDSSEKEAMHILEASNGKFYTIHESGCSCYDPSWAEVEEHPTLDSAMRAFKTWEKQK